MKLIEKLRIAMLNRVKQFGIDHPLVPAIPKATAHYGEVDTILATLEGLGGSQALSTGTLRGTTGEKSDAAENLRQIMGKLARTAKILDKSIYPTIAAEMRLTGTNAYQDLRNVGLAFADALADKTAVFIEYGAPVTIAADLDAAIAALGGAIDHKETARSTRVGSTAGLGAITSQGLAVRRKLNAILASVYENDPVLLAAWNTAKRVHDVPTDADDDDEAEPEGEASTEPASGSSIASAPAATAPATV